MPFANGSLDDARWLARLPVALASLYVNRLIDAALRHDAVFIHGLPESAVDDRERRRNEGSSPRSPCS